MSRNFHKQPKRADLAWYKDGTPTIKITFSYDPRLVELVKTITGRKWNPSSKTWTCPPTTEALKTLGNAGFMIAPKLEEHFKTSNDLSPVEIPGLKKKLFPYQEIGVAFAQAKGGRVLIADEMGLGKTVQAIAWLQLNPNYRPAIIVCPAAVKLNWEKEIYTWVEDDIDVEVVSGTTPYEVSGDVIIINYDIVSHWVDFLIQYGPKALVLDECQMIKNNKTKRTKAVRKLGKFISKITALSGTPILNRPVEFYNIIQILNKNLFPNWMEFTRKYCDRKHDGFGWNVSGASNTEELHHILTDSLMIRRTKKEVLKELPDKMFSFVPLEMDPKLEQEYIDAENNFLDWVEINKGVEVAKRMSNAAALAEIEVLKQLAVKGKMDHGLEWISAFLDSGEKLIVFAVHKFVIDLIMSKFPKIAVKLDGSVTGAARQEAVEKFQNDPSVKLFVGNIEAAGVGITLTAASNLSFLELPWSPGKLSQAIDRAHRITQKYTVNIYYLLAEYTIEEKIAAILDEKRKILDSVLDGVETDDSSLIMELIENYE